MQTPDRSRAARAWCGRYLEDRGARGVDDPIIPLRFNPTEYQLQKANNFAEIPIPGLESPPIQFVRGGTEKLTAELLVDTSDTLEDVREKYIDALRDLMRIRRRAARAADRAAHLGRPGVQGRDRDAQHHVRAVHARRRAAARQADLTLKEYRPVEVQVKEIPHNLAGRRESATSWRRGDTLADVAAAAYERSARGGARSRAQRHPRPAAARARPRR